MDRRGDNDKDESGIERVLRLIGEEGDGGEWVGCMGFSQGMMKLFIWSNHLVMRPRIGRGLCIGC